MSTTAKIKVNAPVTVNGRPARYVGAEDRGPGKGKGTWLKVNYAEKGKPADIRVLRPKNVVAA
jgi:hypothetical protein